VTERRWFFLSVAGALLAAALVGFGRTFYLRPLFDVPPIPGYLYVHGTVLTTWFVLVFAQTCLVAAHRPELHRRLGVLAAAVALLVVLVSAFVVVQAVPRFVAAGAGPTEIQFVIVGDFVSLLLFVAFVASALRARHRPDWHKRLMLVASIVIVLPAVARLERLGLAVPVPAALLLMLAVLAAHDVIASRRLHPATMWSSLIVMIALGATLLVTGSAAGRAVIDALH
jgi:hypothetical protein